MMLAVFGAVRGRFDVLSRVLDEVEDEGIQTVVCTGNIAVGPDPDGVINLLRDRQVHVVQGDTDRQLARLVRNRKRLERVLDARALATLQLAHRACSSANLEWLGGLTHAKTLKIDGESIALINGTASSASTFLKADDADELFRRQREILPARVYLCGGGDEPFMRIVDGAVFVNPGSCVTPPGDSARFATVSTEQPIPSVKWRSLPIVSTV